MSRARVALDVLEYLQTTTDGDARVTGDVVEVLQAYTVGAAPTGSFGAVFSQDVVECLIGASSNARVTGFIIECLVSDGTESAGAAGGGTVSYGFAV